MSGFLAPLAATLMLTLGAIAPAHAALPPVKHVFVIVLENKDYDESFSPVSQAPYLAKELTAKGQLLTNYYGTSHQSLGNYLSMISGQGVNPDTQADCSTGFKDIFPGTVAPDGQVVGVGCVFPAAVKTVAGQLEQHDLSWKGYMQDMANSPTAPKTCRHPAIGDTDDTQSARVGDQYATRHNPFVYFHAIIDSPACAKNVVPLDGLPADLATLATTPNYAFISANLCEDGHDAPCVDGRPGGLVSADAFLRSWVPIITGSPAFREDGMLIITWDEANADESGSGSCCNEPIGPNSPSPGIFGPGGGRTGTVVLSPYVKPGSVNDTPYNHYALLRSVEDIFGLDHLGYAGQAGLKAFGSDVFNGTGPAVAAPKCKTSIRVVRTAKGRRLLQIRSARARALRVRLRTGGRTRVRSIPACTLVLRYPLPRGHGRAVVRLGRIVRGVRY